MKEAGSNETRFNIGYFDGVNSTVQASLAKRTELSHMENARSPQIGILEKREGQTVYGTGTTGDRFIATENYGLINFPTENSNQKGLFRISSSSEPTQTLTLDVYEKIIINEEYLEPSVVGETVSIGGSTTIFQTKIIEYVTISDPLFYLGLNGNTISAINTVVPVSIYALSNLDKWEKMTDVDAININSGQFDSVIAEQKLILVNLTDKNRLIKKDGVTVLTSSSAQSSGLDADMYNSPNASKVCYYKNRLHLADYERSGVRYPTSIIRSSFPLGIIALVDGDHDLGVTNIKVTDTKYFYSVTGVNTYDVYRGGTRLQTITVTAVNETSIDVSATQIAINSSDEIWIRHSYDGEKQFRWINNPTSTGRDVKQYDTFKLSGGNGDPITLFETIGNVIMIGNHYSLASWDDYNLTSMDLNVGCSSSNGSAKLLGTLYFIHYSGIYATTGASPTLLSRKVERYIKGATKAGLENSAGGVKGLGVFFTIGDVTLYKEDGSFEKTMMDVCLEYNVADQNWYIHTNVPVTEFINFLSDDGKEHLIGTREGDSYPVVDFLSGDSDDGEEIFFRIDTQELQLLKEIETFSSPLAVITEVQRGSQMKCFISTDKSNFYELNGSIKKGVTILKINSEGSAKTEPILARKIKVSYRDSSKQRCRISQMAIIYVPTTIDEPTE